MAQQTINVGTAPNDGTGTPLRTAFQYTNSNFSELYTAVGPSGNNIVVPGNATITGDLTVDTSTLKVDSSNNRVGVGTASPGAIFDIYQATLGTAYFRGGYAARQMSITATSDGSNDGAIHTFSIGSSAGQFAFANSSGTRMTLDSSGNLGLGVTPSAWTSSYKAIQIGTVGSLSSGSSSTFGAIFASNMYQAAGGATYIANGYASRYDVRTDNGNHVWYTAASGTAGNVISFTQSMTLDASGRLLVGPTSANTSGGILQLSSGITFPATQVASSDANTLDDYEEGTWTGTIGGTTGNPTTPVTSTGRYTKIGRQVYVEIGFYGDTTGASSRITVSGLPFVSNASLSRPGAILMDTMGTFTGSPVAFLGSGATSLDLYASNSNGAISSVTHNAGAGRALYMELTYTV